MVKKNMRSISIAAALVDGILNLAAFYLAYRIRFFFFDDSVTFQPFADYLDISLVNALLSIVLYAISKLYAPKRLTRYPKDISTVVRANIVNILLLTLVFFVRRIFDFSRWMLVFYFILSTVFITGKHLMVRCILHNLRNKKHNLRHVLLIGSGNLAAQYYTAIQKNAYLGYHLAGFLSTPDKSPTLSLADATCLGQLSKLDELLGLCSYDEAVIALDENDARYTRQAISLCNRHGQRFSIIPYFSQYVFSASAPQVNSIDTVQIYNICASPLDSLLNRILKRSIDIFAAAMLLVVLSPILLFTAIGVKCSSKGPVFFGQQRVGRKKQTFKMYKFRSMRVNTEQNTAWSQKGDTRVTAFGRFIRKTSIDEFPQFFNVLKGDMSLVGPRPEIPFHVDHFRDEIPYYMARHQVRPGITGYAQINGYRGDTSIEERINHDLYYIYNWSFSFDINIIFKTIFGGMMEK